MRSFSGGARSKQDCPISARRTAFTLDRYPAGNSKYESTGLCNFFRLFLIGGAAASIICVLVRPQEMSDVLLYLLRLADKCHVDLPAVALAKIRLNAAKYPAELVKGSSKKYNEY